MLSWYLWTTCETIVSNQSGPREPIPLKSISVLQCVTCQTRLTFQHPTTDCTLRHWQFTTTQSSSWWHTTHSSWLGYNAANGDHPVSTSKRIQIVCMHASSLRFQYSNEAIVRGTPVQLYLVFLLLCMMHDLCKYSTELVENLVALHYPVQVHVVRQNTVVPYTIVLVVHTSFWIQCWILHDWPRRVRRASPLLTWLGTPC